MSPFVISDGQVRLGNPNQTDEGWNASSAV